MKPDVFFEELERIKPTEILHPKWIKAGLVQLELDGWKFVKKNPLVYLGDDHLKQIAFNYEMNRGGAIPYVTFFNQPPEYHHKDTILLFQERPVFIDYDDGGKVKHDQYEDEEVTTVAIDSDAFMEVLLILATMGSLHKQCALTDEKAYIDKIIEVSGIPESREFYEERLTNFLE